MLEPIILFEFDLLAANLGSEHMAGIAEKEDGFEQDGDAADTAPDPPPPPPGKR